MPQLPHSLRKPSIFAGVCLSLLLSLGGLRLMGPSALAQSPATSTDAAPITAEPTEGQPANPPESPANEPSGQSGAPAADTAPAPDALSLLKQVQQQLVEARTISATIRQQVLTGADPVLVSGSYQSSGIKLRLEYRVELGTQAQGSLLEVCDGDVLWSRLDVLKSQRVTRRDVREIIQAAQASGGAAEAILAAEMGLGGLPALFASLQRTMVLEKTTKDRYRGISCWVLTGRWSEAYSLKLRGGQPQGKLPPQVPDLMKVFVDQATLLPVRVVYFKQQAEGGLRATVNLEFVDVLLNEPVADEVFVFVPPDDVVPEDVTRQFVEQITQSARPAAAP